MVVGNNKDQEQWAIFLAAICGQTYTQFSNMDGWERFGFILESSQEILLPFGEPARGLIGYLTSWLHKRNDNNSTNI